LPQNGDSFLRRDLIVFFDVMLEVWVADFLNDIVIVTTFHHIQHPHHVLALQKLQDLHLRKERLLEVVILIDFIR
jgi:hypothetical protein